MVDVIYEDNHIIVVNKPFCMPAQGDDSGDLNLFDWVKEYIKRKYNKPGNVYLGLLHRIDRPTGGIMLLARTSKAASRLSKEFQQRKVKKVYYAITENAPRKPEGQLEHYLKRLPNHNVTRAHGSPKSGGKLAQLDYQLIKQTKHHSLLEIHPHTGRQHQIRVQLASIGCPIVGDVKYGAKNFLPNKSIALLAYSLAFKHPTQKTEVLFHVNCPNEQPWATYESLI